jgi:hypothetical protein
MMKAQVSTEFLAFMAIGIAMLAISLVLYSIYSNAAGRAQRSLEADGLCMQVSSLFSSVSSLGDGASADFSMPATQGGNYTVWMLGDRSLVKVEYFIAGQKMGVGCHFPAANVTNATASVGCSPPLPQCFMLMKKFTLQNNGGTLNVIQ